MKLDEVIDKSSNNLISSAENADKKLFILILSVIIDNSEKGNLVFDRQKLAGLDNQIINAIRESGYSTAVDDYYNTFTNIDEEVQKVYDKEGLKVVTSSPLIESTITESKQYFRGNSLIELVVKPLSENIRQASLIGLPTDKLLTSFESIILEKSILKSFVTAESINTLEKYTGSINKEVREKYGLKWFNYVGSLIETSRPICDHIRDNFVGKSLNTDNLKIILDDFCPNGIPSKDKITYTTVNGVTRTLNKGSGMYENTFVENFDVNTGGHNCRHKVFWTRRPIK